MIAICLQNYVVNFQIKYVIHFVPMDWVSTSKEIFLVSLHVGSEYFKHITISIFSWNCTRKYFEHLHPTIKYAVNDFKNPILPWLEDHDLNDVKLQDPPKPQDRLQTTFNNLDVTHNHGMLWMAQKDVHNIKSMWNSLYGYCQWIYNHC